MHTRRITTGKSGPDVRGGIVLTDGRRHAWVGIVQRRLTHYREPLFEVLRTALWEREIDLALLVGQGTPAEGKKSDVGELLPYGSGALQIDGRPRLLKPSPAPFVQAGA